MTLFGSRSGYIPKHKRTRPRRRIDEASNSFALFIVMAPVVFGAFGMGLDISRNMYIRTTLQNSLDLATVAGAGVTTINSSGQVDIDNNGNNAFRAVKEVYAVNRPADNLDCWGTNQVITGSNYRVCWREVGDPVINRAYLRYTVRERSRNAFLPVIGIEWQRYTVVSQARVNQATQ